MIDPRFMSLVQWTDAVNLTLATLAPPTQAHGADWQRWATDVIAVPAIAAYAPPHPALFDDWRAWAQRFVQCVPL